MDRQSLSTIVDLQRAVREGQMGEQSTMQLIAERARSVAYASGVAIGLLNRDHLFYAAGTGTAMSYVGMRVKAMLSVSRMSDSRAEILRVENAEVDQRIEAAVCRQFRAKSLLILPVFRGQALAGVLHVLFDEPHVFEDQEMRTYRILSGILSEALFQSVSPEQRKFASTRMSAARAVIEQKVATERRSPADEVRVEATALVNARADAVEDTKPELVEIAEVAVPDTVLLPAGSIFFQKYLPLYHRARISELAVAAVVAVFAWVLCTQRPATGASAVSSSKTPVENLQASSTPKLASPTEANVKPTPASVAETTAPRSLAPAPTRWKVPGDIHVKRFGEDVTVRYLSPRPAAVLTTDGVETRQLSDDVTVRYIRPRNAVVKRDVDTNTPAVQ